MLAQDSPLGAASLHHESTLPSLFRRTSADFFERMYRRSPDPWNFESNSYELDRYHRTLAALPNHRFTRAFEPGCSVGVLTEHLATRCDRVDAIDLAPSAVAQAQVRCAHLPNVSLQTSSLSDWLAGNSTASFDLLLLSEIGYYFTPAEWSRLASALIAPLAPGATIIAVHWLGYSPDHVTSSDSVHATLAALPGLTLDLSERHPATTSSGQPSGFRLDRWSRA